jgi:hypothetical protein
MARFATPETQTRGQTGEDFADSSGPWEWIMNEVDPVVRHMLLCDDVQRDPVNPNKVNVIGLVSTIQGVSEPPFPLLHPELCVYLQVTGGRGEGDAQIVVQHADSDQVVFSSPAHRLVFSTNPLSILGIIFRIQSCVFPGPGLYWVQFWYNQKRLAQQPLLTR